MAGNMFGVLLLSLMVLVAAAEVLEMSNKLYCSIEEDQLYVYRVPKHSCSCSPKSEGTLRYHNKKLQICDGGKYVDVGGAAAPPPELGRENNPGTSCNQILSKRRDAKSGVYYLKQGDATIKTYCFMGSICGSRGWTMIMKIDGSKKTFHYSSKYWSNKQPYNVAGASGGLDNIETKLDTYYRTPFGKLCLGMKTGGVTQWMPLEYRASSLYALIADGKFRETRKGRDAWKSIIRGSSLQRHCNREGFNVLNMARIGIVSNQENNCKSPDSRLGFGTAGSRCGQKDANSAGNEARCSPDNGDKSINSFGYIFSQEQLEEAPLGSFDKPAPSCKDIQSARGDAKSGVYHLKQGDATIKTYCFMGSICGSRGWTMIMKIDGSKKTFHYRSKYWSNKQPYNVAGASGGLDNIETKLDTYYRTPFGKLCLGMKTGGVTQWMPLEYRATSLYALIADGKFRETRKGRDAWKSIIRGSSLQRHCNREGFNVLNMARIGIVSNQENNCKSPDSRLGFGTAGSRCGQKDANSAGNEARCSPDNGDKSINSFGYIFAQ